MKGRDSGMSSSIMLRLKSCPRCRGDLLLERDSWGWYEQCIQCGYLHDLQEVVEVRQRQSQEGRKEKWSTLRGQ